MVFDFSAISEPSAKEAAMTPPKSSPMVALKLPTFKWGAGDEKSPARPSEAEEEAAMAPYTKRDASFGYSHLLPHEGGGGGGGGGGGEERRKRNKEKMAEFRLPLSNHEIDEDFFGMTGHRAPRRSKRRPKPAQISLERLFPGSLLPKTIAPDRYN